MTRSFQRKRGLQLILLLVATAVSLSAQSAAALFPAQGRQSQRTGFSQGQQPGTRSCTPADFGDPTADCAQLPGRYGAAGAYNPYDLSGVDPTLDPRSFSRPFPGDFGMDMAGGYGPSMMGNVNQTQPVYNQKEAPNEFQRYVAASIGQLLPIFGAYLFERVPATFAPLDRSPVGADFTIAPGDELQVAVWGQFNLARRVVVDRSGQILLPDAGPVAVAGMNYAQAATVIRTQLARLYKNFEVSVSLARLHTVQVFVVGEARRPGSYTVSSLSTLVNAIFTSGGPTSRGSMRRIELRRGDQVVRELDLYQLLTRGDKSKDAQLSPGDVIFIPPAGTRVAIAGSVEHPGIYEIQTGCTMGDALQMADGLSPLAARNQIVLERIRDGAGLEVDHLSVNTASLQTVLRNGDIIRLQPIVPRFNNAVTLRGNVANPGRFPWKEGMRVSDLIPDKESLLTRDYWKGRNELGDARELMPQAETGGLTTGTYVASNASGELPEEESDANGTALAGVANGGRQRTISYQESKRDGQGDASLGASTGLTNLPPVRTFNPRNILQPTVPDINWSYAAVERTDPQTLSTQTLSFNLGKLVLAHDAGQNLELRAGDVVTIFSTADYTVPRLQQTVQVRVEGEIAMAGTYTVLPGESLRQLVTRAGGLTPNAYLYGVQFTRESTRREQQKRFENFLDQLERQMNTAASNISTQVTSLQQASTAQSSLLNQRTQLEHLRKTNMDGRIVFNLEPASQGISSLPDLPLENGDRLYVPSRPATVNVIGDVFEQSSFLYHEDYRTGDYLKEAGGAARSADRGHMFVIRADGSVVSRRGTPTLFAKSFDALRMSPGDTLVVPTYINKTTLVRGLIDWSQIFTNFALGAAAVNILH